MRSSIRGVQRKMLVIGGFGLLMLAFGGCSLCSPGFMNDYATVGGKWVRQNPTQGRLGSPMSDSTSGIGELEAIASIPPTQGNLAQEPATEVYDAEPQFDSEFGSGIEIVPQYEQGSIILGDGW